MKGLRGATLTDLAAIEDFQREAYVRTEAIIGARAIPLEWDYRKVMAECEIWLDERDGALAGVLILRILEDRLFLESIATAEQVSESGVGRALMATAFARARKLGLKRVELITDGRNPAVGWYRKLGFSVVREEQQPDRQVLHMSVPVAGDSTRPAE
ncbi:GNAT family N-acetyltransferase [Hoeflea sp.]|uniref:GNAT family N-acetyltransferase n=1 Tax=Hoeflea sp. TaxID=1940281 RepID=UPI002AFF19AD|nr:GNAT family N-acetyltransferase [Hoeflea sp.]